MSKDFYIGPIVYHVIFIHVLYVCTYILILFLGTGIFDFLRIVGVTAIQR